MAKIPGHVSRNVFGNHLRLTNGQQLYHLRSKPKWEADKIVQRFPLSDCNYELGWQALKDRFENKRILVTQQLKKLFDISNIRHGDSLSCDFFNILIEKIICAAGLRHTGTIFYKSIMSLAYAGDVDIICRSICEGEAAFSKFAEEVRNIGLAVNESKTKLLLSTAKDTSIGVSA